MYASKLKFVGRHLSLHIMCYPCARCCAAEPTVLVGPGEAQFELFDIITSVQ